MRRLTNFPIDVALGQEDRIYVLCRNEGAAMIRRYSTEDKDLGVISGYGKEPGQLTWPVSIIADSQENLYVSDEALHRISAFDKDGKFLSSWGEQGSSNGHLNGPAGIAFDADENIYVADSLNHRVQKFTKDGQFLTKWGGQGDSEGKLNMPWGIAADELGDVYVADWRNDRIQKFTANGEFLFAFGKSGSGNGEFNRPSGVTVDQHGDIYVADWGNNRIQLFNSEGRYVQKFMGDATLSNVAIDYMMTNAGPNRLRDMADLEVQKYLRHPKSVTVSDDGLMYVPDNGSYRVQVYQKQAVPLTEQQFGPPRRAPSLHQE
ncbi:NHL repeat-containing protein [Chloroflexi bacterium TSY]|nr:NHL repeat-containing protein [Chloroflexi bacterium TSY]